MFWKSRKGFLVSSTFSLPKVPELFQAIVFIFAVLLAFWRVEKEEEFLWFEEEGMVGVLVLSYPQEKDTGTGAVAEITGGDFPELYGKRALLFIYGASDLPSKSFSFYAHVKAEGSRVFIRGSYADIEKVTDRERSIRDLYIQRVEERLQDNDIKALVLTYLFGESMEVLPQDLRYYFQKTGLVHLLVISGFHVGMIFLLLRFFLPYPYGLWLGALGVSLYVLLLVPKEPPVLRALLMLLLWVWVRLKEGRPNTVGILLFSASLLLLMEPGFVRSYSFWLSFLATLYILLGLRLLPESNSPVYRHVLLPFGVSFFAFLGVSPLLLSFTNTSMGSVLFSPLVGYLFIPFTLYCLLQLFTFFSLPSFPLEIMGKLILQVVSLLSHFDTELNVSLSTKTACGLSLFLSVFLYALTLVFRALYEARHKPSS